MPVVKQRHGFLYYVPFSKASLLGKVCAMPHSDKVKKGTRLINAKPTKEEALEFSKVRAAQEQKKIGAARIFEVLRRIYDEKLMESFSQMYPRSHGLPPIIVAMCTFTIQVPRAPAAAASDAGKCGTSASDAPSGAGEACAG